MWKIKKPCLEDAVNDISIFEEMGIIEQNDVLKLQRLVQKYDSQKGSVTQKQLKTISTQTAISIKKHYPDTYAGKRLNYLSQCLKAGVLRCPCCSISGAETLDHYMPKADYKALALCRLNLVPMCWQCNNTKSNQPYKEFIHAYYTG